VGDDPPLRLREQIHERIRPLIHQVAVFHGEHREYLVVNVKELVPVSRADDNDLAVELSSWGGILAGCFVPTQSTRPNHYPHIVSIDGQEAYMAKRFSDVDSEGSNLVNFQLSFWRLAVEQFNRINEKWRAFAVEEDDESEEYTENDFVIDAAVALVLAGTSVTELMGQNVPAAGNRTEGLRSAYKARLDDPIPADIEAFFAIYDALRHFGPAKHLAIDELTEDGFCRHLNAAQNIWNRVMGGRNQCDDFKHTFTFGN